MNRTLIRNPYIVLIGSSLRMLLADCSRFRILPLSASYPGRSFFVCSSYAIDTENIRRMYGEYTEKLRPWQGGDRVNRGKRGKRILSGETGRSLNECGFFFTYTQE